MVDKDAVLCAVERDQVGAGVRRRVGMGSDGAAGMGTGKRARASFQGHRRIFIVVAEGSDGTGRQRHHSLLTT